MTNEQIALEKFPVEDISSNPAEVIDINARYRSAFLSGIKCGQEGRWMDIETAPFREWVLYLRITDVGTHYEKTHYVAAIKTGDNGEFWNGMQTIPADYFMYWMPLPPSPIK